jgi:putative phosphoserine phosphatase / 1-acylglycerol-3-phosphate O-acyltransferase
MQAEVPMVPIVLRNVGEVMWRGAQTLSPGTVEVVVLPAVDTSGWRRDTIDDHVAEVRQQFLETLASWPDGGGAVEQPVHARVAGGSRGSRKPSRRNGSAGAGRAPR